MKVNFHTLIATVLMIAGASILVSGTFGFREKAEINYSDLLDLNQFGAPGQTLKYQFHYPGSTSGSVYGIMDDQLDTETEIPLCTGSSRL